MTEQDGPDETTQQTAASGAAAEQREVANPHEALADEEEARFLEGLVVRGEVVPPGTDPLPPGATHETVEEDEHGAPRKVRRRRFSAY